MKNNCSNFSKQQSNPLVSVIMCVYNTQKKYLIESVQSVLDQTYENLELIIIDDASNSNLFDGHIFEDERIKIFRNKKNKGPSFSRNVGIKKSSGDFVAFFDSDDVMHPNKIAKQIDFLINNEEFVGCTCWYKEFGIRNTNICIDIDDNELLRCLLFFRNSPAILPSSLVCRKELLMEVKFDEKIRFGEDWKFIVLVLEKGKIGCVDEPLFYYRVSDSNITSLHKKGVAINDQNNGAVNARSYVMNKLGGTFLTAPEIKALSGKIRTNDYKLFVNSLLKIEERNNEYNYYSPKSLKKAINLVWTSYVEKIHNPIVILMMLFDRMCPNVFKIKFTQNNNRIIRLLSSFKKWIKILTKKATINCYWIIFKLFLYKPDVMSPEDTINIVKEKGLSLSRFGDGEFRLMIDKGEIGFQKYSKKISLELNRTFRIRNEKLLICSFDYKAKWKNDNAAGTWLRRFVEDKYKYIKKIFDRDYVYGNTDVTRFYNPALSKYTNFEYLRKQYIPLLKTLWNNRNILVVEGAKTKLGVGNNLFNNALSVRRIICPGQNAFDSYHLIYSSIVKNYKIGDIVLIALGPTASILAADLTVYQGMQCIDIGHVDVCLIWCMNESHSWDRIQGKYVNESSMASDFIVYDMDLNPYRKEIVDVINVNNSNIKLMN